MIPLSSTNKIKDSNKKKRRKKEKERKLEGRRRKEGKLYHTGNEVPGKMGHREAVEFPRHHRHVRLLQNLLYSWIKDTLKSSQKKKGIKNQTHHLNQFLCCSSSEPLQRLPCLQCGKQRGNEHCHNIEPSEAL